MNCTVRTLKSAVIAVVFLAGVSQAAFVPSWQGQPGSTYQQWQFCDASNPASPDVSVNAAGTAAATVTPGEFASGWLLQLPGLGSQTGYWDLGSAGVISLSVPISSSTMPLAEIWVQTVSFVDITAEPVVSVPGASLLETQHQLVERVATGGDWILTLTKWEMQPGSMQADIAVTSDAMWGGIVDRVIVDTFAVPEPASLALLAIGGMAVLRRRLKA